MHKFSHYIIIGHRKTLEKALFFNFSNLFKCKILRLAITRTDQESALVAGGKWQVVQVITTGALFSDILPHEFVF
ncbi:hypothetical protein, partial [Bartonella sp. CL42QHWL]|uniref:hypothetical protein n=1 Tax=Bartonella sp. CL42QHWL TaxID=3243528 RepID=UPI0035CF64D7